MPNRTLSYGFTLVELLIVVVIVGILAAIAYPSYTDSVRESRRADGVAALLRLQLDEEKWRANNTTYTTALKGSECDKSLCWSTNMSPEGHYLIAITGAGATGYTATATAQGDQGNDKEGSVSCKVLTLTVAPASPQGARTPTECW